MPEARIMEFHYPLNGDDPKQIEEMANSFLSCLSERRQVSPSRPVIFIAHGKGGLILEKALVLDSTASPPQLIRPRNDDAPVPNQETSPNSPAEAPSTPDRKRKTPEGDLDPIPQPKVLHSLSLVAGVIFLETSIENPEGYVNFHRKFACVIVEWDIPVQWYRGKAQTKRERSEFEKSVFKVISGFTKDRGTSANCKCRKTHPNYPIFPKTETKDP